MELARERAAGDEADEGLAFLSEQEPSTAEENLSEGDGLVFPSALLTERVQVNPPLRSLFSPPCAPARHVGAAAAARRSLPSPAKHGDGTSGPILRSRVSGVGSRDAGPLAPSCRRSRSHSRHPGARPRSSRRGGGPFPFPHGTGVSGARAAHSFHRAVRAGDTPWGGQWPTSLRSWRRRCEPLCWGRWSNLGGAGGGGARLSAVLH